jgi:Penicillin amidase
VQQRRKNGKWTLAGVASAMNTAANQNVLAIETVPLLARLLKGSKAPNKQTSQMLATLVSWSRHGGNLLPNAAGQIANPGAAIINVAWPKLANAFLRPVLGPQLNELNSLFSRFDSPPGGQYNGWYQYFDRDIDKLLKIKQPQPFRNSYCGKGNVKRCRTSMWNALAAAGKQLTRRYGTSDPSDWRTSAAPIAIHFAPVPLITMQYTNRPSGIQQVISFKGHR